MKSNKYINGRIQKGFIDEVPGCLEHTTLTFEALKDAKSSGRSICVTWLDLQNAFGSVRHSLIDFALERYHLPQCFRAIIASYYSNLHAQVTTRHWSTNPFPYQIGVFQGCTISPYLFDTVFQMLIDVIEQDKFQAMGYCFYSSPTTSLLSSAYADDLQITTKHARENQLLLDVTDEFLQWTRTMKAKPSKCKSLAQKKFDNRYPNQDFIASQETTYSAYDPCLSIAGKEIEFIRENHFKYLGRLIQADVSETKLRALMQQELTRWMTVINISLVGDNMKLWMYNFYVIPKISWWLIVADLSFDFVEHLQALVLPYLKSWAGLPRPANPTVLFCGKYTEVGLKLKTIPGLWKQLQVAKQHMHRNSADDRINNIFATRLQRESGNLSSARFLPAAELQFAETSLQSQEDAKTGKHGNIHRLGLGLFTTNSGKTEEAKPKQDKPAATRRKDSRKKISAHLQQIESEEQLRKLRTLSMQGNWVHWDSVMKQDLSWNRLIYGMSDNLLKFLLKSTTNTLPTKDNLRRWGAEQLSSACALCGKKETVRHVLSGCIRSLNQGRYTWRHNCVLKAIKDNVLNHWERLDLRGNRSKTNGTQRDYFINFVKPDGSHYVTSQCARARGNQLSDDANILRAADDWCFLFDEDNNSLVFPTFITETNLRVDSVIYSRSRKHVILAELTVPDEDRLQIAHNLKTNKYAKLVLQCQANGWRCDLFTIEVGSRGYVSHSLVRFLKFLGLSNKQIKNARSDCSAKALRCSYVIYLNREKRTWNPWCC